MRFPFSEICVLLSRLEEIEKHDPPLLPKLKRDKIQEVVCQWFKSHRSDIDKLSDDGVAALLSALLPERRTDRVYGLGTQRLFRCICRAVGFSKRETSIFEAYKQPGKGDLGSCLEKVLEDGGPPARPPVELEEVDEMLLVLAGGCSFSDPSIPRLPSGSAEVRDKMLCNIIKRLEPTNGKWLVRMILKNFAPVRIDEDLVLRNFHFLLPDLLRFQNNFRAAGSMLRNELREYHDSPDWRSQRLLRIQAAGRLRPVVGTKIGRPNFEKARSIDHCLNMLGVQKWTLERKYDGEYCEIHVDLLKSPNPVDCIKIFAKSGKNATSDRSGIHQTIIESLRLGNPACRFKKQAILLGELVVFSDKENCVMPFEKIRKYVTRSGRMIGTKEDSQKDADEHLAIVYFDLLLLDDEIVMNKSVEERRVWLRESYKKIHGRAIGAEWKIMEFDGSPRCRKLLLEQFAASNARRCEGLVLKPCGVPYISLEGNHRDYKHSYIKLKKDYINGMGDEADFAVIGASYNAQQAVTSGCRNIKWTTFHLGCLLNKQEVRRFSARPIFKHVGAIDQEQCIPKLILEAANSIATFVAKPYEKEVPPQHFDIQSTQLLKMDVVFDKPFVFEVLGSEFERPSDSNFLMLRHPRVKKLHEDRSWEDCVTFEELQVQGKEAREIPTESESQETRKWVQKLEQKHSRKFEREKSMSPRSRTTTTPARSVTGVCQRTSPEKPVARRVDAVASSPDAPLQTSRLPSSPLQRPGLAERPKTLIKRRSDDERHTLRATTTKKPRFEHTGVSVNLTGKTRMSSPLSEISNNAETPPQRHSARPDRGAKTASDIVCKAMSLSRHSTQVSVVKCTALCEGSASACAFHNATVFLAPCIANTPYITEDLVGSHNVGITTDLCHWNRDSFAHAPLKAIVSESQSHPGMRKFVLVESKRRTAVQATVQRLSRLNEGRFRERIEVYDWRVLEQCVNHDLGPQSLKKHFLGATVFDDTRERAIFVSRLEWLQE